MLLSLSCESLHPSCRRCSVAFTLIELLTVMAIISLLAAMLLPVLKLAMDSARTVKCHGNFKQIGIGWQLYADDWGGYMPTSRWVDAPAGSGIPRNWAERIRPYVGRFCGASSGEWHQLPAAVAQNVAWLAIQVEKIMGFLFEPFSSPARIGLRAFGTPSANVDCAVW